MQLRGYTDIPLEMASVQVECHVSGDAKRMAGREGAAPGDLDPRKISKLQKCKDCKILQGNIHNSTHQYADVFVVYSSRFFPSVSSMYSIYIYIYNKVAYMPI